MKTLKYISAVLGASLLLSFVAHAQDRFITIGTGGQTGVYYALGNAICRLVNRDTNDHGIKCTAQTGGSISNLNGIAAGDIDFGVAQSDWQYYAYKGGVKDKFPMGANKELRSVFSAHPEAFTILARKDANIKTFDDLKGKRVNIGDPGSGNRGTMEVVMKTKGWTKKDFSLASELKASDQASALCDNQVDAILYFVGNPNGALTEASTTCDTVVVSVEGKQIDRLVNDHSYYRSVVIPAGTYKGTNKDIKTFGVAATFVSSTKTSNEVIYQITKAVFENFDRFKKMHPIFSHLSKKEMLKDGLTAPLHEGAIKYYKEAGLLK